MSIIYHGRYHTRARQKTALQRIFVSTKSTSLLLQHLSRRALHPQLGVAPVQELEMRRQRRRILPLSRRVNENALQMKRRRIRLLIRANLHSKQPITRSLLLQRGRVTAPHNNLSCISSVTTRPPQQNIPYSRHVPPPQSDPQSSLPQDTRSSPSASHPKDPPPGPATRDTSSPSSFSAP
jgi:hypothetical protein